MIDRSEVVVHLVLGDEGRYVVDAVLRFLFHVLADHIIHRFLSDAGQVGHLRGVVEQSSIGVGDFALLRCGEFVLFLIILYGLVCCFFCLFGTRPDQMELPLLGVLDWVAPAPVRSNSSLCC